MKIGRLTWLWFAMLAGSCATESGDKAAPANVAADDSNSGSNFDEEESDDEVYVSRNFKSFSYSAKGNPLSSKVVDKRKAREMIEEISSKIKRPTQKDKNEMVGLIVLHAVAGSDFSQVLRATKNLVTLEMKQKVGKDVPQVVKLQVALAAIENGNIPMAEYYLIELLESKNRKIKAAAYTAQGYIALADDRLPEAITAWNTALKAVPNYDAALLNIGYFSLKYGDHVTATQMFEKMRDDWFARAGLIIASRLAGDVGKVSSLCQSFDEKKEYKPVMLSCALNAYQGEKNYDKALDILKDLIKSNSPPSSINEQAHKLISQIERDKRKARAPKSKGPRGGGGSDGEPTAEPTDEAEGGEKKSS
jgi:tetratricopeptide (TPR) repeat protein